MWAQIVIVVVEAGGGSEGISVMVMVLMVTKGRSSQSLDRRGGGEDAAE